jgi:hypothetical protein
MIILEDRWSAFSVKIKPVLNHQNTVAVVGCGIEIKNGPSVEKQVFSESHLFVCHISNNPNFNFGIYCSLVANRLPGTRLHFLSPTTSLEVYCSI